MSILKDTLKKKIPEGVKRRKERSQYPVGQESVDLQSEGWKEKVIETEVTKLEKIDMKEEVAKRREERKNKREINDKLKNQEKEEKAKVKEAELKRKEEEKEILKIKEKEEKTKVKEAELRRKQEEKERLKIKEKEEKAKVKEAELKRKQEKEQLKIKEKEEKAKVKKRTSKKVKDQFMDSENCSAALEDDDTIEVESGSIYGDSSDTAKEIRGVEFSHQDIQGSQVNRDTPLHLCDGGWWGCILDSIHCINCHSCHLIGHWSSVIWISYFLPQPCFS